MKFKNANQRKAVMAKIKRKPIAVNPQSNWGGIAIYKIDYDIDDKVKFRWEYGQDKLPKMSTAKIRYSNSGRPYFKSRGSKFYFDEFMRTDIK